VLLLQPLSIKVPVIVSLIGGSVAALVVVLLTY